MAVLAGCLETVGVILFFPKQICLSKKKKKKEKKRRNGKNETDSSEVDGGEGTAETTCFEVSKIFSVIHDLGTKFFFGKERKENHLCQLREHFLPIFF